MEQKKFTRTIEDFICGNCGREVYGNGYTNHCPVCLWSKHVDINPGDRAQTCGGLMKPIEVTKAGKEFMILHHCVRCDFERRNRVVADDVFETVIKLSAKAS